jgi:hypothetical protein
VNENIQEKVMLKKWSNTKRSSEGKNFVCSPLPLAILNNNPGLNEASRSKILAHWSEYDKILF